MSLRARKLSTVAYIDVDDSASTSSRFSRASTRASQAEFGPVKRRRTSLNTRYDRMIESVNAVLPYRNSTPTASRRRDKSSSTSSVSSHDLPKTPVDTYSNLYLGKLGKDFSVLKMKKSSPFLREDSDGYHEPEARAKEPRSPLPDWLANTFCTLESDHPLRGLLSTDKNIEQKSSPFAVEPLRALHEEQVFAFSPFQKQTNVLEVTRPDSSLKFQESISHGHPQEIAQPDTEPEELALTTDILPFSTPGYFAPVRKSVEKLPPLLQKTLQEPLIPVTQEVSSRGINTIQPPPHHSSYLRPYDRMKQPQFGRSLPGPGQDNVFPSDIQDHGTFLGQISEPLRTPNVYAAPGPTFTFSRPVYFDSPTEDPSSSDPLDPESYELDLNAIDFRWQPFMRSSTLDGYTNKEIESVLGYVTPNRTDNQVGLKSRLSVDLEGYGASDEERPAPRTLAEESHPDDALETQPSFPTISRFSPTNRPIGPGWRMSEAQEAGPAIASGSFISPLRDQLHPNLPYDAPRPQGDGEHRDWSKEHPVTPQVEAVSPNIRPSTPVRQTRMPPPSTPHKVRLTQLRVPEIPVRKPPQKTSSALSWMVPLKTSKRTVMHNDEVNAQLPRTAGNSDDTIESWNESK